MRSEIKEYQAVEEAAMKFVKSVAEGNSKYAILVVIRLVSQGHALLPEHQAALPVDVQSGLDGIRSGLFLENTAHVVE